MELLVAGFAIVLLANAAEPLRDWAAVMRTNAGENFYGELLTGSLTLVVQVGAVFTVANLVISVILRSLWISAIGVRSFSGEIDLSDIRAAPRFDRFLRRRLGPFDRYVERLDNLCSAVFALSFLIVFCLVGITGFVVLFALSGRGLGAVFEYYYGEVTGQPPIMLVLLLLSVFAVMVALVSFSVADFMSGSRLKRVTWLTPFYYPLYRLSGWVSLSRLYRPLYYNLVDHPLGRRLVALLVPFAAVLLGVMTFRAEVFTSTYPRRGDFAYGGIGDYGGGDVYGLYRQPHFDAPPDGATAGLYVPLLGARASPMLDTCELALKRLSNVTPGQLGRDGVGYGIERYRAAADCLGGFHRILVDGRPIEGTSFIFRQQEHQIDGALYTEIDLRGLPPGRHFLTVERTRSDSGYHHLGTIPFFRH